VRERRKEPRKRSEIELETITLTKSQRALKPNGVLFAE
jgi:hypothetical protein